jgi:hypothetical protein
VDAPALEPLNLQFMRRKGGANPLTSTLRIGYSTVVPITVLGEHGQTGPPGPDCSNQNTPGASGVPVIVTAGASRSAYHAS